MPKRSYWPPPVYVGRFADGTETRMSIWSQEGKPLDFGRGRRVTCGVVGNERCRANTPPQQWHKIPFVPATDLKEGYFDYDGVRIPDPFFSGGAPDPVSDKPSLLDRLIKQAAKLSPVDRDLLRAAL